MDKEPKFFYRLGDMIRFPNQRNLPGGAEWHFEKFPDSIVSKYLKLPENTEAATPQGSVKHVNTEGLAGIVNELARDVPPEDGELVIHLRIGDIIISVGGKSMNAPANIVTAINRHGINRPLKFNIQRDNNKLELLITPVEMSSISN